MEQPSELVSDDSLTVSPDMTLRQKLESRSRSGARSSSGTRTRKGPSVVKPAFSRARSDTPSTRPPRMRTTVTRPSPVARPILVPPAADTAEARIAALEMQRNIDHHFMNEVVNALVQVREEVAQQAVVIAEHTQSGVRLRQECFAARSELAPGITGAKVAAQAAAMAQMVVTVEATFASLAELTAQLAMGQQILGARGHMVEQAVEQQAAGQPRFGMYHWR